MKVICISENWHSIIKENVPFPAVGEECEVIESQEKYGRLFHVLGGRFPGGIMYAAENFAPISEIDETTFERNYNKELV